MIHGSYEREIVAKNKEGLSNNDAYFLNMIKWVSLEEKEFL